MNRDRASAVAIILGAVAFVVTMALHPTGGDLDHILEIAPVVVGTHSLALASLALVISFLRSDLSPVDLRGHHLPTRRL